MDMDAAFDPFDAELEAAIAAASDVPLPPMPLGGGRSFTATSNAEMLAQVDFAHEALRAAESEREATEATNRELQHQLTLALLQNQQLKAQQRVLQTYSTRLEAQCSGLTLKCDQAEQAAVAMARDKSRDHQRALDALQQQLGRRTEELQESEMHLAAAVHERAKLAAQLTLVTSQRDEVRTRLDVAERERQTLSVQWRDDQVAAERGLSAARLETQQHLTTVPFFPLVSVFATQAPPCSHARVLVVVPPFRSITRRQRCPDWALSSRQYSPSGQLCRLK